MKMYHYALFFAVICIGFFLSAHIATIMKVKEKCNEKTEYDCLVSAVNATVNTVFAGNDESITRIDLERAEEVFFQTLEVLWFGTTDGTRREELRMRIPCIAVFAEDGYYCYCFKKELGYGWSEFVPYENGKIPAGFFEETEKLLTEYHDTEYTAFRNYRVEQAGEGIWEREISPLCVFAIYAPVHSGWLSDGNGFLYAASKYQQLSYFVTEDNRCHLPFCEAYKEGNVIACYSSQKESAEDGAIPCEICMK